MCDTYVIHVWYFGVLHMLFIYMCKTPVLHMLHICHTGVYPSHVLHVWNYMCYTGIYARLVLHVWNMCITHVSDTHVIHLYFYRYSIPRNTTYVLQV